MLPFFCLFFQEYLANLPEDDIIKDCVNILSIFLGTHPDRKRESVYEAV